MYKGPQTKLAKLPKRRVSEYGQQLREKQRLRQIYGIRENQLKNYFRQALAAREAVDSSLAGLLEKRLDNVVYRLGFASTRAQARQLVNHGHIWVNGQKVDIPAYIVGLEDKISIKASSEGKGVFKYLDETLKRYSPPAWLKLNKSKKEGVVTGEPAVEDIPEKVNLPLVIEFYSR